MSFYETASVELQKKLEKCKKFGEAIYVSKSAKLNGNTYREVKFKSKNLQKLSQGNNGVIYINENDEVVDNKQVIDKLARIFYYGEILCDDESRNSLVKAIQSEADIDREKREFQQCLHGLEILVEKQVPQAGQLIELFNKLPRLKEENNKKLQSVVEVAKNNLEEKGYIDEEFIESIKPLYVDALLSNFDKVKFINNFSTDLGYIRERTQKNKRTFRWKFKSKSVMDLSKLEETINYLIKIVSTYDSVLRMSKTQYEQRLRSIEKENVAFRLELLRK